MPDRWWSNRCLKTSNKEKPTNLKTAFYMPLSTQAQLTSTLLFSLSAARETQKKAFTARCDAQSLKFLSSFWYLLRCFCEQFFLSTTTAWKKHQCLLLRVNFFLTILSCCYSWYNRSVGVGRADHRPWYSVHFSTVCSAASISAEARLLQML